LASSHSDNLAAKQALILEAEAIALTDLKSARSKLTQIQAKWSKIGHVPKDQVKNIEGRLRQVESKLVEAEKEAWKRSDPAAKARSNAFVEQLEKAISKLETELQSAPEPKKKEIQNQIESRRLLLVAAQNAVD
jgi:C4-type Zn-finger protein